MGGRFAPESTEGREDVVKGEWVHWKDFIIEMLKKEGLWDDRDDYTR
jgi:hypothetical protein